MGHPERSGTGLQDLQCDSAWRHNATPAPFLQQQSRLNGKHTQVSDIQ
ncbi:hypothetical protein EAI_07880 [Harpegnathos saltator]|uniref:Uncharacterized protein n=1 Tax=Harpegnathos saltator TaxID=610380 RepID=E2BEB0_HARSA|nr:hypothetical protein EAI_07880 [Harpegnathos saltator]